MIKRKGLTITASNINRLIKSLKKKLPTREGPSLLLLPASIRGEINRKVYKGRGRPRNTDYNYIPFPDYLPESMRGNDFIKTSE